MIERSAAFGRRRILGTASLCVTSYRFPAQKNIVPYKRMMTQIERFEKRPTRFALMVDERKTPARVNPSGRLLTLLVDSRLIAVVPLYGL
jgi:hypothetical protein